MKFLGLVAGFAALVAASSANATVAYDTIMGASSATASITITSGANKGPLAADFNVAYNQTLQSVTIGLVDKSTSCNTVAGANCLASDTGSIMVYLASSTNSSTLPGHTGTSVTNLIPLGSILDTSLQYTTGNVLSLATIPTNVTLTAGTYWIEIVSSSTSAKLGEIASSTTGTIGTAGLTNYTFTANSTNTDLLLGGNSTSGPIANNQFFTMTVNTPEPATLSIIGAGLLGLGMSRRRKAKKTA
jgi:hypothetical protein